MTTITSLTDVRAARRGERDTATLVAAAADGEAQAWRELIDRYAVLIRCVCRSHRLTDADADDVAQLTWLRAVEHIGRLRDPDRFGAWVGTTARRECLRVLQGRKRVVPDGRRGADPAVRRPRRRGRDRARRGAPHRRARARSARCRPSQRTLLRLLHAEREPSYEAIGAGSSACRSAASARPAAARSSACAKKSSIPLPGRLGLAP